MLRPVHSEQREDDKLHHWKNDQADCEPPTNRRTGKREQRGYPGHADEETYPGSQNAWPSYS